MKERRYKLVRFSKDEYFGDAEDEMLQRVKKISKQMDEYTTAANVRKTVSNRLSVTPIHGLSEMHDAGIAVSVNAALPEHGR